MASRGGGQPGYRRLADRMRTDIQDQRWQEGELLPTDQELSEHYGLSRQTVRRAYLELVNDGLVYRVRGRGTFITPDHLRYRRAFETVDDLFGLSHDTEMVVVSGLAGTFSEEAAVRLQLASRIMYGMSFLRQHQGTPFCHTQVYLPPAVGQLLEEDSSFIRDGATGTGTVIGALVERGVRVSGAEQSITAKVAEERDVERLGATPGQPILHIDRLYLDQAGDVVEWAVSDFLPEHYTHRMTLSRRP